MAKKEEPKYILDPETLTYERQSSPKKEWWSLPLVGSLGLVLFILYMWVYASVLGFTLPKTAVLRYQNSEWKTRIDQMSQLLDQYEDAISQLEIRDDRIYRSVYGMDEIPQNVRQAGFGGENRYEDLKGTSLLEVTQRLDVLEKRLFIQSKSFEEVAHLQRSAGDMAAHIPAIPPINTDPSTYRLSSGFGGGSFYGGTCGAVVGAHLALSMQDGWSEDPTREQIGQLQARIKEFNERFSERNGSILCREILGKSFADPEETAEIYAQNLMARCPAVISSACDILEELLEEE